MLDAHQRGVAVADRHRSDSSGFVAQPVLVRLAELVRTRPSDSSPEASCSRSTNFCILPVGVLGIRSTKTQCAGALCADIRSRQNWYNSSAVVAERAGASLRNLTTAATCSPHRSSGTPTTAASATA